MRVNVLLFTQTMSALLSSSLQLQDALAVCCEILSGRRDKKFCMKILKEVNEGRRLGEALAEFGGMLPPLYVPLVSIGEESGMLAQVFVKLSGYIKDRKNVRGKLIQALSYPVLVLVTAAAVVFILVLFVMPRLEQIFMAFTESSGEIGMQMARMRAHVYTACVIISALAVSGIVCAAIYAASDRAARALDSAALKIPGLGKIITAMQMHDFSFAMKLLSCARFPLVESLAYASAAVSNRRLKEAVLSVRDDVADGRDAGDAFASETVFPQYLSVWVKIAGRNGNTAEAFSELCDYYSAESEAILSGAAAVAEPVFILIAGAVIIAVISQFVIPVFTLLGAL